MTVGEALRCPVCGTPPVPRARFCFHCGAPLDRVALDIEAERRVVTVLFGDLSDFTSWAEDLDPERVGVVTDRVLAALSRAVSDLGGHVDKLTGDGIMAVFGAPTARGDDAERAVRAAARMQREVRRLVADEAGGGQRLGLRVGLNTGEVLAGIQAALSYTVVGDAVNTASRLSDAARVGSVYAGAATVHATRRIASWRPLPPLRLKGKREPVAAHELIGLRGSPAGPGAVGDEVAFVGREAETGRLVGRFMDVVDGERPAAVLVTGEPGIGKTRLVLEFTRFAGELPGARVLWGRCTTYGEGRDLAPLVDWVRTVAGAGDEAPATEVVARVRRLATRVEPRERAAAALTDGLLALLGLGASLAAPAALPAASPAAGGPVPAGVAASPGPPGAPEPDDPAVEAVAALLRALAARAPLVLVVDDLQAASQTLVEALTTVGGRLAGAAMIVGSARSDRLDEPPAWWRKLPQAEALRVGPLEPPAAERLLRSHLPRGDLDPLAARAIVERGQGNPFFLAELLHLLVDRGLLARAGGDLVADALPAGVQAVLAARIDALDPAAKAVLRDAALVGTRLPPGALEALGHPAVQVREALGALRDRGLVGEDGEGRPVFHHALARDVAYAGIPKAERARRHAAVARWAVGGLAGAPADVDAFVGAHAERAVALATEMGLPPDDPAWAARHAGLVAHGRLGEAAAGRDEHAAAADLLGRALAVGGGPAEAADPARVRRLRVLRAGALAAGWRFDEAAAELGHASSASDATGDPDPALRARALLALGSIRRGRGDEAGAAAALDAALDAARAAGEDRTAVEALRELGLLDFLDGRLRMAEIRFAAALALAERVGDLRGAGWALQHLTWSATARGDWRAAEEALRRARSVLVSLGDEGGLSWCAGTEAFVRALQGRFADARGITQRVVRVAEATGERWGVSACRTIDAIASAELGELRLAEQEAAAARAAFRSAGDAWGEALALVAIGFAARGAGAPDRAVAVLAEAAGLSWTASHPLVESLAVTTLGYCELDRGDPAAAGDAARRALARLGGIDMEPHALVGSRVLLAQALRAQGDLDAALGLLREVAGAAAEASLLFPRRQALAHYAGALLAAGEVEGAARVIDEALAAPAEDVRSRVVAGRVLAAVRHAQGRAGEARRALEEAVRIASATESTSELAATRAALAALTG
ncbi:MAG: AAA family ATPase [Frankiaceae bacterium]